MKKVFYVLLIFSLCGYSSVWAKGGVSLGNYQADPGGKTGYSTGWQQASLEMQVNKHKYIDYSGLPEDFKRSVKFAAPRAQYYIKIIEYASQATGTPVERIKAIIAVESAFKLKAVSRAGAEGLMQLMPRTAKDLKVKDSFNAWENIIGGAKYYKQMLDKFGCEYKALAAYNMGPPTLKKRLNKGFNAEAYIYVKKVIYAEQYF